MLVTSACLINPSYIQNHGCDLAELVRERTKGNNVTQHPLTLPESLVHDWHVYGYLCVI